MHFCDPLCFSCWSYVGKKSTGQTLSIGTYCDHIAVVEHEFLHALGFLHEQSRYDREDYITINWDNIRQGLACFQGLLCWFSLLN